MLPIAFPELEEHLSDLVSFISSEFLDFGVRCGTEVQGSHCRSAIKEASFLQTPRGKSRCGDSNPVSAPGADRTFPGCSSSKGLPEFVYLYWFCECSGPSTAADSRKSLLSGFQLNGFAKRNVLPC